MMICSGCCSTLDFIVSYIFKQLQLKGTFFFGSLKNFCKIIIINFIETCFSVATFQTKKLNRQGIPPENNMFLKVMEIHPEILQNILSTMLNIIMFEDCKNQWAMSRPLFVLMLLYEDYFRYFLN